MRWILLAAVVAGCAAEASGTSKWAHEEQSAPCVEGEPLEFTLPADAVAILVELDAFGERIAPKTWHRTTTGIETESCRDGWEEMRVGYLTAE